LAPTARSLHNALAIAGALVIAALFLAGWIGPLGGTLYSQDCAYVRLQGSWVVDYGGPPPDPSQIEGLGRRVAAAGLWAPSSASFAGFVDETRLGSIGVLKHVPWNEGVDVEGALSFHHAPVGSWARFQLDGYARGEGAGASEAFLEMVEQVLRSQVVSLTSHIEDVGWRPGEPTVLVGAQHGCELTVAV